MGEEDLRPVDEESLIQEKIAITRFHDTSVLL